LWQRSMIRTDEREVRFSACSMSTPLMKDVCAQAPSFSSTQEIMERRASGKIAADYTPALRLDDLLLAYRMPTRPPVRTAEAREAVVAAAVISRSSRGTFESRLSGRPADHASGGLELVEVCLAEEIAVRRGVRRREAVALAATTPRVRGFASPRSLATRQIAAFER
jgi:hypothetical protein